MTSGSKVRFTLGTVWPERHSGQCGGFEKEL